MWFLSNHSFRGVLLEKDSNPCKRLYFHYTAFSFEDFLYKKPAPEVMVTKPPLRFWAQLQSIPNEHHP